MLRRALLLATLGLGALPAFAADGSPTYSVSVKLSPAAEKKLTAMKEGVTVAAMYDVEAGPSVKDGMPILIGEEKLQLKGSGTVTASKVTFDKKEMRKGKKGAEPTLLINVYSSRLTSQDNLLNCDLFQGALSEIPRDKPIEIACKLISE